MASPHQEHRIWAGVIDRTTGHGDSCSLRLDGPTEAWTLTGSSYFVGAYGRKNRVTAWVKTKDVRGEGPTIGFRRWDTNEGSFYSSGITGTTDWTKIAFVTTRRIDHWGVTLYFRNAGTGTAWIDDLKIEPLGEKVKPDVPPGRLYPIQPANPDVVLRWDGQGAADGAVLDGSGYGHHGKFYGKVAWVEDGGRRVMDLPDTTGYVWPLCSSNLTLGPPCTMVLDVKPVAAGALVQWGWNFNYHILGGPPRFGIAYALHGKKLVASKGFLDAGKWSRLVLVVADKQVKLYHNGKLVEALPGELRPGSWGLHNNSTWHRHLSFFGGGPGDMAMIKGGSARCFKGRVGSLVVYKRALSNEEIAALGGVSAKIP